MNIERTCQNQKVHRILTAFLVSVLAFSLFLAVPGLSGAAADPMDWNHACSLRALAGNEAQMADLKDKLQIDLYQIASAEQVSGYDTYTYVFNIAGFEEIGELYDSKELDWPAMAQKAAELVLAENSGIQPTVSGLAEETVSVPGFGLYLLIARGKDLQIDEYRTTVKQKDEETGNVQEKIATLAYSDTRTYTYEPELVSIPSKQVTAEDGEIQNTTGGNGEWLYDMSVTLKPNEGPRYGSLEIVKELLSYEAGSEATFIFQVDAVLNGEKVYSNVIPITFDSAGKNTVVVDRIPVGAQVTVTEIYSGVSYEVVSPVTVTPAGVITLEGMLQADFTNTYTDTPGDGGAITNRFEYTIDNGWNWQKIPAQSGADGA